MTRGVGGHSPANLATHLKGMDFPAKRQDLVSQAKKNKADQDVLDSLGKLPEREYGNMADVMKGYGESH